MFNFEAWTWIIFCMRKYTDFIGAGCGLVYFASLSASLSCTARCDWLRRTCNASLWPGRLVRLTLCWFSFYISLYLKFFLPVLFRRLKNWIRNSKNVFYWDFCHLFLVQRKESIDKLDDAVTKKKMEARIFFIFSDSIVKIVIAFNFQFLQ